MAFERLQLLGEEKFRKVLNALMRGQPAQALAREMQQEWGEFQDVAESTLGMQLNRLRKQAAEGAFGAKAAKEIQEGAVPTPIKKLEQVTVSAMSRLEELSVVQRDRVLELVEKEKKMPVPVGAMLTATNAVFNDYRQLLLDIQKVRFDLGLDEYKGMVSTMKGSMASVTLPDGSNVQKQVFEAVTTIEEIFAARKIPAIRQPWNEP